MSPLKKNTLREIRQSLGRFLAIFAIVALGVGFFSGLRVTRYAMLETGNKYLSKTHLFDYRLVSTLGFSSDDERAVSSKGYVLAAEGAKSADALVTVDGDDFCARFHSLSENVNTLSLVDGRLPESADECVVDSRYFSKNNIGTILTLSAANDSATAERFSVDEVKIVGRVNSPLYLNFERGATSVGGGKLSAFIYVTDEAFSFDYYTEMYVRLQKSAYIYSDEYKSIVDEHRDEITSLTTARAEERYTSLTTEAELKIAEGQVQYDSGLSEYMKGKAEADSALADAKALLDTSLAEITAGDTELSEKEAELYIAQAEIAAAKEQYSAGLEEYNSKSAEYMSAQSTYQDGLREYTAEKAKLDQIEKIIDVFDSEISEGIGKLHAKTDEFYKKLVDSGLLRESPDLDALRSKYGSDYSSIADFVEKTGILSPAKEQLASAAAQLEGASSQLSDGRAALDSADLQLKAAKAQIADGEAQIAAGREAIEDGRNALSVAKAQYDEGLAQYNEQLAAANEKFSEAEKNLENAGAELTAAREKAALIKDPAVYVLDRSSNAGYVCFENDSSIVDGISTVFPVFFFLVAALVCITTMSRMVEEQRTQIGTLKALGFRSGAIASKYIFYSGFAALSGALGGYFLGCVSIPRIIWKVYGIMYGFAPLITVFDKKLLIISLAVAILCSVGTAIAACRRSLRECSAELIRPKSPKNGKRVFLERIPFIWKKLRFLQKVSVRNIMRYKNRMIMMILGVGGCTALLLTGFGINDSIRNIAVFQFDEIMKYDYSISFASDMSVSDMDDFSKKYSADTAGILYLHSGSCDALKKDGSAKSVSLISVENDTDGFIDLHNGKESLSYPAEGEALLSKKLADTIGVSQGDSVTLRADDMKEVTLTVSGVCDNYVYDYVYVTNATCETLWGISPTVRNAYVNVPDGTDPHVSAASLASDSRIGAVSVNSDTRDYVENMMKSLDYIILLVTVCAAALAFIVIYNLTNINITERVREIATLKVLGFYRKEAGAYVFRENVALSVLGAGAGLVMGVFLHRYVMSCINIDMVAFDVRVGFLSYIAAFLMTIVFAAAVDMLMYLKIGKIDMAESLKSTSE